MKRFLALTTWKPLTIYWKGQLRFKASKRVSEISGFNLSVSSAHGLQLDRQIRDSKRFLKGEVVEFRRLRRLKLSAVLDFGVETTSEMGLGFYRFDHALLAALAKAGVSLEVSHYGTPAQDDC